MIPKPGRHLDLWRSSAKNPYTSEELSKDMKLMARLEIDQVGSLRRIDTSEKRLSDVKKKNEKIQLKITNVWKKSREIVDDCLLFHQKYDSIDGSVDKLRRQQKERLRAIGEFFAENALVNEGSSNVHSDVDEGDEEPEETEGEGAKEGQDK